MDRKAWIVVTFCIIGMGLNMWYANKTAEERRAWEAAHAPKPAATAPASTAEAPTPAAAPPASTPAAPGQTPATPVATALPEEKHTLTQGSASFEFTTIGGGIKVANLMALDQVTLNNRGREPIGALRREAAGIDATPYKIVEKSEKSVTFEGKATDGLVIRKTFSLVEAGSEGADDHLLNLTIDLRNEGAAPIKSEEFYLYAGAAASMQPDEILHPGFFWNDAGNADYNESSYFAGGMFSSEKPEFRQSYNWMRFGGVMSRFYAHIISRTDALEKAVPGKLWARRFLVDHSTDAVQGVKGADADYAVEGAVGLPPVDLAPAATQSGTYQIYLGPKEYHRLRDIGQQRDFVMFYGWFTPISKLLTNLMRWMHSWSGNWGVAIIFMTLLIRICLWPLQASSQAKMKKMSLLGPMMQDLKTKYKDDPQKMQTETMKLYRDYGVNPIGGCLPMLLQIPIFFGFFRVLQYAAELRGQGIWWVNDLSMPDTVGHFMGFPVNVLPLIMGVTMFLQMKVTPQPASVDKSQQMIFKLMPFLFLFFCYNFAAALALYWSTQNIFGIFQSYIMRLYQKEPKLEKVERAPKGPPPQNPFFNPMGNKSHKDKKNRPRLGG